MTADDLVLAIWRYFNNGESHCHNVSTADRCHFKADPRLKQWCDRCKLRNALDEYEREAKR